MVSFALNEDRPLRGGSMIRTDIAVVPTTPAC
jgi:hypothetical protein